MRILLLAIICLSWCGVCAAQADRWAGPTVGDKVRITHTVTSEGGTATRRDIGTLLTIRGGVVRFQDRIDGIIAVPEDAIQRFETRVAPSRRGRGFLNGMLVGAGLGLALGLASGDDDGGLISFTAEEKGGILAVIFAPVGGLVGLAVSSGEQWADVDPGSLGGTRLGRGPAMVPGVSLTLRF